MELDELKKAWEDVNNQVSKQQGILPKMIDQMTQTKYKARLKKIVYPELIGTLVSFTGVAFIYLNFNKLNTPFLQGLGIITSLFLLILPVISLVLLWQFNMMGDISRPYSETLKKFALQKLRFFKFQQISLVSSYVLLVFFIILSLKFFGGKDINDNKYFWAFAISFGYIFLYFFSKWVLKSYGKTLRQAEELLRELEP